MEYLVAVGSNLGDRMAHLRHAWGALPREIRGLACAPIIGTSAVGGPRHSQSFLNSAWIVETAYGPHQLLLHLLAIEQRLGRVRTTVNGPRTIDLDVIMAADGSVCNDPFLCMPHPEMLNRPFVLVPALTIAGHWLHPHYGRTLWQLCNIA